MTIDGTYTRRRVSVEQFIKIVRSAESLGVLKSVIDSSTADGRMAEQFLGMKFAQPKTAILNPGDKMLSIKIKSKYKHARNYRISDYTFIVVDFHG
jgi:hypothetical protein